VLNRIAFQAGILNYKTRLFSCRIIHTYRIIFLYRYIYIQYFYSRREFPLEISRDVWLLVFLGFSIFSWD